MQSIKSVAAQLDVSRNSLRYYEKEGLIGPIQRDPNGVRQYNEQDIETIYKIVHLRAMGATIKEIKSLLHEHDVAQLDEQSLKDIVRFLGELDNRLTQNIQEIEKQKSKISQKIDRLNQQVENK
ncbi:MerR family transcriptional regulator [Staphylococcus sp. Marseille-Q5304]|uniref:MerR family transcriptional regulator n=1 Tax=Staphylococcus sp. Marseille-Q5304 TaxID=2942200 RepID=UPI002073F137|nr:MerR family transcriptional regulator [Staphylococcus sp. Marseille-Q5304]